MIRDGKRGKEAHLAAFLRLSICINDNFLILTLSPSGQGREKREKEKR